MQKRREKYQTIIPMPAPPPVPDSSDTTFLPNLLTSIYKKYSFIFTLRNVPVGRTRARLPEKRQSGGSTLPAPTPADILHALQSTPSHAGRYTPRLRKHRPALRPLRSTPSETPTRTQSGTFHTFESTNPHAGGYLPHSRKCRPAYGRKSNAPFNRPEYSHLKPYRHD